MALFLMLFVLHRVCSPNALICTVHIIYTILQAKKKYFPFTCIIYCKSICYVLEEKASFIVLKNYCYICVYIVIAHDIILSLPSSHTNFSARKVKLEPGNGYVFCTTNWCKYRGAI